MFFWNASSNLWHQSEIFFFYFHADVYAGGVMTKGCDQNTGLIRFMGYDNLPGFNDIQDTGSSITWNSQHVSEKL